MIGLGSSAQLGIGISVRLHDQFSQTAMKINNQLLSMRKNATSALTNAMKDYRNNALMVAGAATGVSYGMFKMIESASTFDHIMNQIMILGEGKLGKTRKELEDFALTMSKAFPQEAPKDIVNIMVENVRAGVTKGLDVISKYQLAVATATNEAVAGEQGVGRGLLGIMNSMYLNVKDFPDIANYAAVAANKSMASIYSMNEAMQYFSNTAYTLGINVKEAFAMVAKLSQANLPGSSMGTALANMTRYATRSVGLFQTPKNAKAWAAAGIDSDQVVGLINQAKWFDLISLVDTAMKGKSYTDKEKILDQLFGVRGQRGIVNMFGSNQSNAINLRDMVASMEEGARKDIVMKQSKAMADDVWSDIKRVGNAIARFGIQFLNAAKPTLRVLLGMVTKVVDVISAIISTPVGKVLAGLAVVAAPLIAIMFMFRAAVLTATIAMRGFAATQGIGGFMGLLRGGLGSVGIAGLGALGGNIMKNKAGRYFVAAGKSVNIGGKVFKAGQLLPQAALASLGLSGTFMKSGAGFFQKVGPWMGKVLGWGGKILGWGSLIFTAVELLKGIFGNTKEKPAPLTPVLLEYYKNLDNQLFGHAQASDFYSREKMTYGDFLKVKDAEKKNLNQTINLYMDGEKKQSINLQTNLEDDVNNGMDFEIGDH